ncbi:MAG TPA: methyltransferase domain-containing protein [Fimbriiglobus sp.]|nr:methyltransferase domain-containing protein [Fimbriiglobus sp.]
MELRELQTNWDQFGRTDPMWAILTHADKRGGGWKSDEFFATGRQEIAAVLGYLAGLGLPKARRAALDFGCGLGRLTQALGEQFERVTGVDIAPSMIDGARRHNRHGDRCRYVLNDRDDLSVLPDGSFDLIYSNIVLQHMRPEYSRRYVREFVRLLTPGGAAVFQLPSEPAAETAALAARGVQPLPDSALRCRITVSEASVTARAGDPITVTATVENAGDQTWQAGTPADRFQVRLGNHWRDEAGEDLLFDDARVNLPGDVPTGARVVIPITVQAPAKPGRYVLELDMVQEHVAWFATKGGRPAAVSVHVGPALGAAGGGSLFAKMEMHGVPWLSVIHEVVSAGGLVFDVQRDEYAGAEWIGYRYCIGRRG